MKTISKKLTDSISLPSRRRAFTLIELLVVIAIIGVIAGLTLGVAKAVGKTRKLAVAKGELAQLQIALENYKAKYGVYPPGNQNTLSTPDDRVRLNQLYYELSGTTKAVVGGVNSFVTLDSVANIPIASIGTAYGVGGFVNCAKGGGEDVAAAKNFLPSLTSKMVNNQVTNNGVPTTVLVTSVGGPDDNYLPLGVGSVGINPIRYLYPGTNNPSGYDLWVQLQINNTKYLICNWSKSAQVNTSYP
jgi:prepilin-type N-terminal cleavage/methylation domain-containing protein